MYYQYLIRRLLPFTVGFLSAVFVTSFFQTVGSLTQTANVPEVAPVYYGGSRFCRRSRRAVLPEFRDVVIRHKPTPKYTAEARMNGTEGSAVLRVTFLASGEIGDIEPLNDVGDGLTEEATEAARLISFQPATEQGVPVSTTKTVEYTFSIY
jgi:TonB family protein